MAFITSAPTTLVLTVVTISGRFGSDVIFEDVEQVEEPPAKLGAGRIGGNAGSTVALPIASVLWIRYYIFGIEIRIPPSLISDLTILGQEKNYKLCFQDRFVLRLQPQKQDK
jgi:hypothetical protein